MKKLHVVSVAAALLISANALATETKPDLVAPEVQVTAEIGKMLEDNSIVLENDKDISAAVRFTLNESGEIVVLSVQTEDDRIESFVKARLNYNAVTTDGLQIGKTYEVPIRFTS
jgi:hypothetical protein